MFFDKKTKTKILQSFIDFLTTKLIKERKLIQY